MRKFRVCIYSGTLIRVCEIELSKDEKANKETFSKKLCAIDEIILAWSLIEE